MSLSIIPLVGGVGDTNITAAARDGTTITGSGTAHVKGSYSSLVATTTKPSFGIWLMFKGANVSATNTSQLVDIAIGNSGGGSEEVIIPNIMVGACAVGGGSNLGRLNYFPCYIPSGLSVRCRLQGVIISDTLNVSCYLDQDNEIPRNYDKWIAYGADTATSGGTAVTPASGSFGTWTAIGGGSDPTRTHRIWAAAYAIGTDTTVVNASVIVEIGTGPDSSNVTTFGRFYYAQGSAEEVAGPLPLLVYRKIKAATKLWARIASAEAEARQIVIYGGG